MKVLRIILNVIGIMLIVINTIAYFAPLRTPKEIDTAGLVGWYIGKNLLLVVGGLLVWWAYRIKRKSNSKQLENLIDSLPG